MAAATVPYISVDEYLHSTYDPDVDYVDGALEERNLALGAREAWIFPASAPFSIDKRS